ncbi:histidine kinase dimerization/phospho-acceptor domain-containing protein [Clostridium botulinum]|uniref:histidine kinase dimerization/phospho-acceptor domain-containing protein n=1 Tax=Clostridium botulinum TaxID=1491 RepID=UPI00137614FD|nr:HAMP domain-containing histidine kinase [Clostridium botulinum]HCL4578128.1 HAMP domain-containing histidine kinase [Clostridium botulinum]HCL4581735.1 HAMP domain-containing histidine kinase [Clostridium botulinum]HDI4924644.1 HAMP domain-containing histidine kinase [Clostridium botulinum]
MVLFIISLIITIFGMMMVLGSLNISSYNINKFLFPEHFKDKVIIEEYEKTVGRRVDRVIKGNINQLKVPHKMDEKLKKEFPYNFRGKTLVYIINSNGEILSSNNEENMYTIPPSMIKETLSIKMYDDNIANIRQIKKINNDLYIVIISDSVIDGELIIMYIGLFIFMIIFAILAKGRLKYIISIKKGVNKLYSSDFEDKIPLKYNNELTSLAIALNDMGGKIKENKENEKEFLLNISHDLRTPLTSILGFLNLLKQKKYDTEEEREGYINTIEEQSLYLKTLIDEFFQFSTLKWKNVKLNKENINLQEILRQINDGFYPQLKENKISMSMNFPEKPLYKEVDVDKFMRVLENVISNAIKYSHKGTEISLNLYENKDKIVMEFWNTPIEALKEDELDFLFKRFYKKDLSRGNKGAGLGLSIALEAVKLHGGELYAVMKNERLGIIIKL